MIIRTISLYDAEDFLALKNSIDESGFMLYEPNERKTTVDEEKKSIR